MNGFTSGLGLDAMTLFWPTVVQLVVSFNSGLQWGISQEYSFFVSSMIDLILCFRFRMAIYMGSFIFGADLGVYVPFPFGGLGSMWHWIVLVTDSCRFISANGCKY